MNLIIAKSLLHDSTARKTVIEEIIRYNDHFKKNYSRKLLEEKMNAELLFILDANERQFQSEVRTTRNTAVFIQR